MTGQDLIICLGFQSFVARLPPFERVGTKRPTFLATLSVNSLRISAPLWWPLKEGLQERREVWRENEKCEFLARESVNSSCDFLALCEFLARESVNSSPILARQWWRHFRLSVCLSLSLTPSAPLPQYRKRFRASYNCWLDFKSQHATRSYPFRS